MDSSDSLKLDENLARFLAAFDQGIEGGDAHAPTLPVFRAPAPPRPTERAVTPLQSTDAHEGSLGELLPDSHAGQYPGQPLHTTPAPVGGPHRVGRFELRRQLGRGGCGIVFLAYDPKLQREVALKIPRPEMFMNEDAKRRLIREALAAAEFNHPNLVPVYETGEIGPICFIATAFCPGLTLAEWLDKQAFPVPLRQAARLVATIADAVQHAHDRGVLHRDLKPNNVILQELQIAENDEPPPGSVPLRGDNYLPRVVDFGLAKLAERGGPSETGTRQILGTPKYMSPEQAQARREDIGPPADVYALGVTLYELIAGRAPYDGATDVEVLRQSVEGRPTMPRDLRPDIPRDLEAICLKAMARTTADRYRTAIDLADDLRRFLDGLPTIARPLAWSGRAVRWIRRNDQIVAIGVLTTIALFFTVVAIWNTYQFQQFRTDRDKALQHQADRTRSDQQREYVQNLRESYLAWRSGNTKAATESLEYARRATTALGDPADFPYDYLARKLKTQQVIIACPYGAVTAMAVSPDGTRLASGHGDGTITIWERGTGRQLGVTQADEGEVSHLAFVLGGSRIISVSKNADASSRLAEWPLENDGSFTPIAAPQVLVKDATCCAVTPSGTTAFAGTRTGQVVKLALEKKSSPVRVSVGTQPVVSLALASRGEKLWVADARGHATRFTSELKRDDFRDYQFPTAITALCTSDGGLPTIAHGTGEILVVSGDAPATHATGNAVHWLAANQTEYAHNGKPGRVLISGRELITGDTGIVRTGVFSPDGKTLFTGSDDGLIRAWNLTEDIREQATMPTSRVLAVGLSDDANDIVVATTRHTKRIKTATATAYSDARPLRAVRLLEGGIICGIELEQKSFAVVELSGNTSKVVFRAAMPAGRTPVAAAWTPDRARVAIGDDAGRVTVWAVGEQSPIETIDTGLRRPANDLAISDDGRLIAARTKAGVTVWMLGTPGPTAEIAVDEWTVFRLLPQDRIATGGKDSVVRIWTSAGREVQTLHGHIGRVTGIGLSPDGRTLVTGDSTGETKFWDMRTSFEVFSVRRHSSAITTIEFSTNGRLLVTGGHGQLAIWDAR